MFQNRLTAKIFNNKYKIIFFFTLLLIISGYFFALMIKVEPIGVKVQKEVSDYIISKMKYCHDNNDISSCYKANAADFLNRFKLSDIMAVFSLNEKNPEFFSKCHETSHYLGRDAYAKFKSIPKVFEEATHACLGGVYHGAIEGYFMSLGIT